MSLAFWIVIAGIVCLAIGLFLRWFNRKNSVEVYTPRDEDQLLRKLEPYFRRDVVEAKVNEGN